MRPTFSVLIWCACFLLASLATWRAVADEPQQDTLTAEGILDRTAKTYSECKSYRDTGLVETLFIQANGNRTVEKPFTTAFIHPDRFRFEYRDQMGNQLSRYIIWANGKDVQTWWDVRPGVQKKDSLASALGAATGVSSGSARRIPGLLLSDQIGAGWDIKALGERKRIEDAKLAKVDCFRVQGVTGVPTDGPVTLWIDKATFLVRRIDEQGMFDNFRTETTTTYDPVIDGEITDKMLEFDPPK